MDISYLNALIASRIPSILLHALFFLIIVLPFFYFLTKYYKKHTLVLETEIKEKIKAEKQLEEYKVHLEEIVQSRTEQLQEEVRERKLMSGGNCRLQRKLRSKKAVQNPFFLRT